MLPCGPRQWACRSGDQCVPDFWHCDRQSDCRDSSDEVECKCRASSLRQKPKVSLQTLQKLKSTLFSYWRGLLGAGCLGLHCKTLEEGNPFPQQVLPRNAWIPSSSVPLAPASASAWCVMGERTVQMVQMRVESVLRQPAAPSIVTTPATRPLLGQ